MKKEKIDNKIQQLHERFQKSAQLLNYYTGKTFPVSLLRNNSHLFKMIFYIEKHYEVDDEYARPYCIFEDGSREDAEVNIIFNHKNHRYHFTYYEDKTIWLTVNQPEGENGKTALCIANAKGTLAGFQKMMKHIKRFYRGC